MAFLDKLTKGVSKAAEQAKFEADKLMRVNKLNSEVSQLTGEVERTTAAIGAKVIELRKAGGLQLPELDELVNRVSTLEEQLAAKKAELEAVKAEKFEEGAPAAQATVTPSEAAPSPKYCPNCGVTVQPGAKFCPSCGQKLG